MNLDPIRTKARQRLPVTGREAETLLEEIDSLRAQVDMLTKQMAADLRAVVEKVEAR